MSHETVDCPHCGVVNSLPESLEPVSVVTCEGCDQEIRIAAAETVDDTPVARYAECPKCKAQLSANSILCVGCGTDLRSGQPISAAVKSDGTNRPRRRRKESEGRPLGESTRKLIYIVAATVYSIGMFVTFVGAAFIGLAVEWPVVLLLAWTVLVYFFEGVLLLLLDHGKRKWNWRPGIGPSTNSKNWEPRQQVLMVMALGGALYFGAIVVSIIRKSSQKGKSAEPEAKSNTDDESVKKP